MVKERDNVMTIGELATYLNPRIEFVKRVMRSLTVLEARKAIDRYRAKNRRVRLA